MTAATTKPAATGSTAPRPTRPAAAARHANPYRTADQTAYATLGVLGELLITLGLALLAFLVWQLWWTDVEANRAQAQISQSLHTDAPTPPAIPAVPGVGDPPVLDEPDHTVTFAEFQTPRWPGEPARPISQGTDRAGVLDPKGIGHYPGTAMPGGVGNFAIAGHRTTYGKPFNRIAELQVGDPLVIWTPQTWYVYRVTSTQVVPPTQTDVVAPVPGQPGAAPTQRLITLTSCHPMFSARQRYIVHGELDYWAPTSSGTPKELLDAGGR